MTRLPLLVLGMASLLAALWLGLVRLGWQLPEPSPTVLRFHGALMVSGFLATVIALERAVALDRAWAYAAPLLSGLGAAALLAGVPLLAGGAMLSAAGLGLLLIYARLLRMQPGAHTATMTLAAAIWTLANLLWTSGQTGAGIVHCWAAFLVLTIAGERRELGRVVGYSVASRLFYGAAVGVYTVGVLLGLRLLEPGVVTAGTGMLLLVGWLVRHDIAWRNLHVAGLSRFMAACLLSGYAWLAVAGLLYVHYGPMIAGPIFDAMIHSVFLGFVISMIFGHAPVIFPGVIGLAVPYRPRFYAHLTLLHASLVLRVGGDLLGVFPWRAWGAVGNAAAILLFLLSTVASVAQGRYGSGARA